MEIEIGCLSFNNPSRKTRMENRFQQLGLKYHIFDHFEYTDTEQKLLANESTRRIYSIMINHLKIIQYYYENSTNNQIIVCEDDVYISRKYPILIDHVVSDLITNQLNIILLGYLLHEKLFSTDHYLLYNYGDQLWGAQCYIITRQYAGQLLDKYVYHSFDLNICPFSSDWIITKPKDKRAIIYPLLFLEEGHSGDAHVLHEQLHQQFTSVHYNPELYV